MKYVANIRKIFATKFFKNTSIVFAGNIASRVIGLITFILLARYLSVNDYGILTVMIAVTMTITDLINSGMNASIVRFSAIYSAKGQYELVWRLFFTSFVNMTVISSIAILIISLTARIICMALFKKDYSFILILSSFGILTTFYYSLFCGLAQGLQKFNNYFIQTLSMAFFKLILICGLFLIQKISITSIVVVFVVSPLLSILCGFIFDREFPIQFFKYDKSIVKEVVHFGKWIVFWSIVSIIQSKLDTYLLAPLKSAEAVSYYDVANKFTSIIMIAASSYATVLLPKLTSITDSCELKKVFKISLKISATISFFLLIETFIFPIAISIVFGPKYLNSIMPLRIMLISLIPFVFTIPYNTTLTALGHSKAFFYIALVGLVTNIISSLLLIKILGATGSAISFAIVNVFGLISSSLFYRYYSKKNIITKKMDFALSESNG